jgi:hypothetical protein
VARYTYISNSFIFVHRLGPIVFIKEQPVLAYRDAVGIEVKLGTSNVTELG